MQYDIITATPHELDLSQSATQFAADWNFAVKSAEDRRRYEWHKLILEWLDAKESRTGSRHTRRNYEGAVGRWLDFISTQANDMGDPLQLWEVDSGHVRAWQHQLQAAGLSDNYVNHQLSCVSSMYSFVIAEKRLINGVEIDMFVDTAGRTRANPFKSGNIQRARVDEYAAANPLSIAQFNDLLTYLEQHQETVAGARNYALIATYLYTGWRSAELLRMQWKDIRPSQTQPGTFVFKWRGKGGKKKDDVLPAVCFHAIVHYLKLAGRWLPGHEDGLQPDDYIWLPVVDHTLANLRNVDGDRDPNQPISGKSALRVLRNSLRHAGIPDADRYRIHDLRHTHARLLLESGHDINIVRDRLNHSSLATTGRYTAIVHKADPIDSHSASFMQLRAKL